MRFAYELARTRARKQLTVATKSNGIAISMPWWDARADEIESRTIDVHVRRLRAKLGPEGRRITTVKSVGYRLEDPA